MTQELLKTLINYDPVTGIITRIQPTTTQQSVGDVIATSNISFYTKNYSTTRIIYLYMMGEYPSKDVILLDPTRTQTFAWDNLFLIGSYDTIPLTCDILRKFVNYDPITGLLTWRLRATRAAQIGNTIGTVVGILPDKGYIVITLFGVTYQAHRLAWLHYYGQFPDKQLDHIDHDRTNNSITNLRETSLHTNMKNKSLYTTNTTGYSGVTPHGDSWLARIGVNGTKVLLGTFRTFDEAVAARKAAEKLLDYHVNHGLQKPNDYSARK